MKGDLGAAIRDELRFLPRIGVALAIWLAVRELIPTPENDFWAAAVFVGELVGALLISAIVVALVAVRPVLNIDWFYPNGSAVMGRTQTLHWSEARPNRRYRIQVSYRERGLGRLVGLLVSGSHERVLLSCIPDMALLMVEWSANGATRSTGEQIAVGFRKDRNVHDEAELSFIPRGARAVTNVRIQPVLECNHRAHWHKSLMRSSQNVDAFDLVYSSGELT